MTITEKILEDLSDFKDREEALRKITRYSLYKQMFYRTNLWIHTRRVAWIVECLIPLAKRVFGNGFDGEKAVAMALIHDDAEILFGDIQAGNKFKMTPDQLAEVKKLENDAIEKIIQDSPKFFGKYVYGDILIEATTKPHVESIIVDWADKFDAFCESLHEFYAGNRVWAENVVNEYGTIPLPTEYYMNYFNNFTKKFPKSVELFKHDSNVFKIPTNPDVHKVLESGSLHTPESIKQETGYEPYDFWLALTIDSGTDEDVVSLYKKVE